MTNVPQFPIMIGYRGTIGPCPSSIPWDAIAPYDKQAQLNHGRQTLQRLAERGGLDPTEAYLVMIGSSWDRIEINDDLRRKACAFLDKIVKDRTALMQVYRCAWAYLKGPDAGCSRDRVSLEMTVNNAEKIYGVPE